MSLLRKASIVTTPTSYENGKILSVKPSVVLGNELITNGDFATDLSGWIISNTDATNTITWETNGARIISTTNLIGIQQDNVLTIGKSYKLTCNVAITTGSIGLDAITAGVTTVMVEGFNEIYFTAVSDIFKIKRTTTNSNCLLDNVSVKEALDADFDFTRNSSATRVNSQGLIEDITSNLPRIDYTGGVGHWLFEPQSTNLWSNSEGSDITLTSPLGTFGFYNITSSQASSLEAFTAGAIVSATFIVKKADGTTPTVTSSGSNGDIIFRITGTSNAGEAGTLTDIGNGFYTYKLENYSVSGNNSDNRISNNSGDVVYVSLIQLEQNSHATSYIPTNGSTVTRLADAAFGAGSSDLINSTEGVLYAEIAALTQSPSGRRDIALSDGTSSSSVVRIHYLNTVDNTIRAQVRSGGSISASMTTTVTDIRDFHKIAVSYKVNEVKLYIDGVLVITDTSAAMPIGLNQLSFSDGDQNGPQNFYGKTKCVAVFKEALTDAELTCLTTI